MHCSQSRDECWSSTDVGDFTVDVLSLQTVRMTVRQNTDRNVVVLAARCQNYNYRLCYATDLASGGCISAFKWNGGREYKGKPWNDSLPTDSTVCTVVLFALWELVLCVNPLIIIIIWFIKRLRPWLQRHWRQVSRGCYSKALWKKYVLSRDVKTDSESALIIASE